MIDSGIIPLSTVGVADNDGMTTSLTEMDAHAFWNLMWSDDTYVIQLGCTAMHNFNQPEMLMKAHPLLFPFECGGCVEVGDGSMKFVDHAWWSVLYNTCYEITTDWNFVKIGKWLHILKALCFHIFP